MSIQNLFTKKALIGTATTLTLLAPCLFSTDAIANPNNGRDGFSGPSTQGGYTGPSNGAKIITIKQANNLPDDSWATLRGKIISQIGKDIYLFEDASGQGKIEIDDDVWRGVHVNQDDIVEIVVEVDKEWNRVKLDAEQIRKVK